MGLFLVRHPQPLVAPGTCYGSTDLAVAPSELARAVALLSVSLPHNLPLYSSPLQRCAGLASQLAASLKCASLTFDARLVEIDFGQWEMRRWDDIARAEIDAWAQDVVAYHPGGGESTLQMAARIAAFYAALTGKQENAIVICHAGTMRLLAACQAGLSLPQMTLHAARTPHKIGYGATIVLDC
jgi:alpha-ribazole phosphatase